jgi:hypothetical protein
MDGLDLCKTAIDDVGEVPTHVAEGDVEHHRVEAYEEGGRGNDRETRPRSGSDVVIAAERSSIHA